MARDAATGDRAIYHPEYRDGVDMTERHERPFQLHRVACELVPERQGLRDCHRLILSCRETVNIHRHHGDQTAFFWGLLRCGNNHICPLCPLHDDDGEARLYTDLFTAHEAKGGRVVHLTYSLKFSLEEPGLETRLKTLNAVLGELRAGRSFNALKERYGWIGAVTNLEVTFEHADAGGQRQYVGVPHRHAAVLLADNSDLDALAQELRQKLVPIARKHGLEAGERAVWITEPPSRIVAGYIVRSWGKFDKDARGLTPLELLALAADIDDESAKEAWRAYALALRWKRHLSATPNLWARVMGPGTSKPEPREPYGGWLGNVGRIDWRRVVEHEAQGKVLTAAATRGAAAVAAVIAALPKSSLRRLYSRRR